eukprot:comp11665_c0_seq1/m.6185 comp11665_c0_seq1/g.6185  ORF comp11665_c0_seq1/g.6185 comp11665_c0_seq1/m.6185 type:complete len:346 (-) comp11665_c0_seq1:88-1125(-)
MAPHGNNANPEPKKKKIDLFRKRDAPGLPNIAAYNPPPRHAKQPRLEKPPRGRIPEYSTSEQSESEDEDVLYEGLPKNKKPRLSRKSGEPKSSIDDLLLMEEDSQENQPEPEPKRPRLSCREQQVNVNPNDVEREMLSLVGHIPRQPLRQTLSVDVGEEKDVSEIVHIDVKDPVTDKHWVYKLKRFDIFNKIFYVHTKNHPEWEDMQLSFNNRPVLPFHTPHSLCGDEGEKLTLEITHEQREPEPEEEDDVVLVEEPITRRASSEPDNEGGLEMFLKLRFSDKDAIQVKVRKDKALRYMAKAVCKTRGLSMAQVKICFDSEVLDLEQTPQDLDMENDDCLEVHVA